MTEDTKNKAIEWIENYFKGSDAEPEEKGMDLVGGYRIEWKYSNGEDWTRVVELLKNKDSVGWVIYNPKRNPVYSFVTPITEPLKL